MDLEEREALKRAILGEIGLHEGLKGSILAKNARINAARKLPRILSTRTLEGDHIAFTRSAHGLYCFAVDVAKYGDIDMREIKNTREVIEKIIDLLIDLHDEKNNAIRRIACNKMLKELVASYALFMPKPVHRREPAYATV